MLYSKKSVSNVNSVYPDQTPHSVAPDLGLQCLPVTILGVSRLKLGARTKSLTGLYIHCCILFIMYFLTIN